MNNIITIPEIDKFLERYKNVSNDFYTMQKQASELHEHNLKESKRLLPIIKKAIVKEIFNKNKCYPGIWQFLYYVDKSMGPHWQLNELNAPKKFSKKMEYPGPIYKEDQLDTNWVESRILNRYFAYYYPKYDLLEKELKIKL